MGAMRWRQHSTRTRSSFNSSVHLMLRTCVTAFWVLRSFASCTRRRKGALGATTAAWSVERRPTSPHSIYLRHLRTRHANAIRTRGLPICFEHAPPARTADRLVPRSTRQVWRIVKEDPLDGSPLMWGDHVRLRHVGSISMLAIRLSANMSSKSPGRLPLGGVQKGGKRRSFTRGSSRGLLDEPRSIVDQAVVEVVPTTDLGSEDTLFALAPQYEDTTGNISLEQFFCLQHVKTGYWLHCKQGGAQRAATLPLLATLDKHDTDVFGMAPVCEDEVDDLLYTKTQAISMRAFFSKLAEYDGPEEATDIMEPLVGIVSDLIVFVTDTDEVDPLKREGVPILSRQIMLREQGVLDLATLSLTVPFHTAFSRSKFDAAAHESLPWSRALKSAIVLCMCLCRHILRDCVTNKLQAISFVPLLQENLGKGLRVAETLREVFADNAEMLDCATDEIVSRFVHLIREVGRDVHFLEFLIVLCQCDGKAVRPNQWRVCRLLVQEAPELLFRLCLRGSTVCVSGDPRFFPAFESSPELELSQWLSITTPSNAAYFEYMMELFALLVRGRNLKNVEAVQGLLPYNLVEAAITSPELNKFHLRVVTHFVQSKHLGR